MPVTPRTARYKSNAPSGFAVPQPRPSSRSGPSPRKPAVPSQRTGTGTATGVTTAAAKAKSTPRGQSVTVSIRKRPLNVKEAEGAECDIVSVADSSINVYEPKTKVDLTKHVVQHQFTFDNAFDEDSTNKEVFERTAKPLVDFAVKGGRASCFAFGQTGSGKTHTMMGEAVEGGELGLYTLAANHLFESIRAQALDLMVKISFFEIYADELYDLQNNRAKLFAREDAKKRVCVQGLTLVEVRDTQHVLEVMEVANQNRSTGSTGANDTSSRSHAVMQFQLVDNQGKVHGKVSFIDLAGSERGADTYHNDKTTRLEGAQINKSLLALKECIRAMDMDTGHTPFRSSKLTQVLKDSFTGTGRTAMIANIAPTSSSSEHTLNTLRYADRVKQLRSKGSKPSLARANSSPDVLENADPNPAAALAKRLSSGSTASVDTATPPSFPIESPPQLDAEQLPVFDIGEPVQAQTSRDSLDNSTNSSISVDEEEQWAEEVDAGWHETKRAKIDSEPEKTPGRKPVTAHDLLSAFRKELNESMALMEREVSLLDRMERSESVHSSVDDLQAMVQAKIDMAMELQEQLQAFQKDAFNPVMMRV